MTSKGKKIVADSFSSSQPGYISVAGETFFLNLPDDQVDTLQSRLMDDSLKGDVAFQTLFLGGESTDTNPKGQFTKQEQILLRRIFRTIFGVNSIPTKKGISLPCKKDEIDLLLRALEIRRKVLIGEIEAYDNLASSDIHARYMREHLLRLNNLIGDEIPNTVAPCKNTNILDPNAPTRLPLDDTRMLRLLEIFAFLLAQGKDPLESMAKFLPKPADILPRMAIKDAPGLKEYEDAYTLANPGSTPTYTDTLSKIKQILVGQVASASGTQNQELEEAFEDIEDALGITSPKGSYTDRANVLIKRIEQMENEKKQDLADLSKVRTSLASIAVKEAFCKNELAKAKADLAAAPTPQEKADLGKKVADLEAEKQALEAEKQTLTLNLNNATADAAAKQLQIDQLTKERDDCQAKLATSISEKERDALQKQITDLENQKKALEATIAGSGNPNQALLDANTRIAELETEIQKLQGELASSVKKEVFDNLQAELASVQAELAARPLKTDLESLQQTIKNLEQQITDLNKRAEITPEELTTLRDTLTNLQNQVQTLSQRAEITPEELTNLKQVITDLNDDLNTRATPDEVNQLRATIATLEQQVADLGLRPEQSVVDGLRTQVTDLNNQIQALNQRPTADKLTDLQNQIQALNQQLQGRAEITPDALTQLQNQLTQANQEINQLRNEVQAKEAQLGELVTLRQQLQQAQADIQTKTNELTTLQHQLAQKQGLEGENQTLQNQIQDLQNRLNTATQNLANLTGQLNQRPTQEQLNQVTQERDDARQERDALRTQLAQANAQVDAGRIYKFLYTKLNEFLARKGLTPLPDTPTEDTITSRISDLEQRMNIPPPPPTNTMSICLLNLLYTLIRRMLSKHGLPWSDSGAAKNNELWKTVFNAIQNKAVAEPIPEGVIRLFFIVLTNLLNKGEPTGDGYSIISQQSQQIFTEVYNKAKTLLENNPLFMNEHKECAAELLNEFFPTKYNFKMVYILPTGRLQKKVGMEDLGIVNLGSVFLLILTMTQQVLNNNQEVIQSARCAIPDATIVQAQAQTQQPIAPGPAPSPAPSPTPTVIQPSFDMNKKCNQLIPVNSAKQGASVNDSINLITGQATILQMYPFCLDVRAWLTTNYDKKDLVAKIKSQILKVVGDPNSPGFSTRLQIIINKYNLFKFRIQINPQSADVKMAGGGNKTRKHKNHKLSKKSKTYKRSK